MRRDEVEIGLEREYALYAITADTVAYLLANDRLLACFADYVASDAGRRERWHQLQSAGWRLAPEYSRCLVEIASPPYVRNGFTALLTAFACLEDWLAHAAAMLQAQSRFEQIVCTAEYSVRSDRYVAWDGASVTAFRELLLDAHDANWLLGSPEAVPACLVGCAPELSYAGFTSTNATLHPPTTGDLATHDADLASCFWDLLHAARRIEIGSPQRHAILRDGRVPVPPDPELSVRDALIRWGDPRTATLLDDLHPLSAGEALAAFEALFAQRPSASFTSAGFHAYSCRPRALDDTMLFELRCFHSGLPLAKLAPLLDTAARWPSGRSRG